MATIFTRIINGDIPGTFVWRDQSCVAFMSINPLREGHTLVVPIQEVDHWIDAPGEMRDRVFEVSQVIARAIHDVWRPTKVGMMIAGLEVPHLHVHLVPMDGVHDLDFGNAASSVDPESLRRAAERISAALADRGTPSPLPTM